MKKIFDASEIEVKVYSDDTIKDVINRTIDACNAKLEKLMAEWPVVYFSSENALGEIKGSVGLIIGKKEAGETNE